MKKVERNYPYFGKKKERERAKDKGRKEGRKDECIFGWQKRG